MMFYLNFVFESCLDVEFAHTNSMAEVEQSEQHSWSTERLQVAFIQTYSLKQTRVQQLRFRSNQDGYQILGHD